MAVSTVTEAIANKINAKISELQMMLSSNANFGKCVILVEGVDDRKLYSSFINDSQIIINVLGGCYHMPEILSMIENNKVLKNKVIGIKDADFDHITGKTYPLDNLFETDTHDWETMMLTKECEDKVTIEALDEKTSGLFNKVMKDLSNYSYIKFYNEVEILSKNLDGILFEGFCISKVYDGEKPCEMDESLLKVKKHGNNEALAHYPSDRDIDSFKRRFQAPDLMQLTCGHDLIHGIVQRLTKIKGVSPKIGYNDICRMFRVSCTMAFFRTTQLYQAVFEWAHKHNVIVWAV